VAAITVKHAAGMLRKNVEDRRLVLTDDLKIISIHPVDGLDQQVIALNPDTSAVLFNGCG
jgi:hypothetical protein